MSTDWSKVIEEQIELRDKRIADLEAQLYRLGDELAKEKLRANRAEDRLAKKTKFNEDAMKEIAVLNERLAKSVCEYCKGSEEIEQANGAWRVCPTCDGKGKL